MSGDAFSPDKVLRKIVLDRDAYVIKLKLCPPWHAPVGVFGFPEFLRPISFAVAGRKEAFKAYYAIKTFIHMRTAEDFTLTCLAPRQPWYSSKSLSTTGWRAENSFTDSLYGYLAAETLTSTEGDVISLRAQAKSSSFYTNSGQEIGQFTFEEVLQAWPLSEREVEAICKFADGLFPD